MNDTHNDGRNSGRAIKHGLNNIRTGTVVRPARDGFLPCVEMWGPKLKTIEQAADWGNAVLDGLLMFTDLMEEPKRDAATLRRTGDTSPNAPPSPDSPRTSNVRH